MVPFSPHPDELLLPRRPRDQTKEPETKKRRLRGLTQSLTLPFHFQPKFRDHRSPDCLYELLLLCLLPPHSPLSSLDDSEGEEQEYLTLPLEPSLAYPDL